MSCGEIWNYPTCGEISEISTFVMQRNLKFLHMTNFSPHVWQVIQVTNMRYAPRSTKTWASIRVSPQPIGLLMTLPPLTHLNCATIRSADFLIFDPKSLMNNLPWTLQFPFFKISFEIIEWAFNFGTSLLMYFFKVPKKEFKKTSF